MADKFVALRESSDARIAGHPFDGGADWTPLSVANAHTEDCAESDRNSFANLKTPIRNLVIQHFGIGSPVHRVGIVACSLRASVSVAVAIASVPFAKTRKKSVLKLVQLLVLLMHLVQSLVIEFLAAPRVDLMC